MEQVKVLWPDGPRYVSEEEVCQWAFDAMVNEKGADPDTLEMPDIDQARTIVHELCDVTLAKRDAQEDDGPPHDAATATGMYDGW